MDHVAILSKKGNWLKKILAGEKTIESRWYVNRVAPWNRIKVGDTVYFKEAGEFISAKSRVLRVIQYKDLDKNMVKTIVGEYGKRISPGTKPKEFIEWIFERGNKRYCILIFIGDIKQIEPFEIDKTGYGSAAAWLCVGNITKLMF
jgi:ASC-1-like (ASCH) protein